MLLSTIAGIGAGELLLRSARIGSDQLLRPDPVLGVRFIESKTGLNQGRCFSARVSINPDGWRSPEVPEKKGDGAYRVLVLGDSFMAGLQVDDDEIFSSVLERTLERVASDRRVEVINLGVPSWGNDQEYLALREYGLRYRPDLVVLAFYAQNDVSDNSPAFRPDQERDQKPFFDVRNGELVALPFRDPTPVPLAIGFRFAARFRLYSVSRDMLLRSRAAHRLLYSLGLVQMVPTRTPERTAAPVPVPEWPARWSYQSGVFSRQYTDRWRHAWRITEAILARANEDVQRTGAKLLLVDIASPISVMPESIRAGLLTGGVGNTLDVDRPTRRIRAIAERNGIPFLSLVPPFRRQIGESDEAFARYFLPCDGHWTPAGHRLAAHVVATWIKSNARTAGER